MLAKMLLISLRHSIKSPKKEVIQLLKKFIQFCGAVIIRAVCNLQSSHFFRTALKTFAFYFCFNKLFGAFFL